MFHIYGILCFAWVAAAFQFPIGNRLLRDVPRMSTALSTKYDKNAEVTDNRQIITTEFQWKVLPDIWDSLAARIPNNIMLLDNIHENYNSNNNGGGYTYSEVNSLITKGAAALQRMGLIPGDCVSIFSENSHRWFIIEQSIMKAGGCNAVRGAMAPIDELQYIYHNSRSMGVVVENLNILQSLQTAGWLNTELGNPKFVIVLYPRDGMTGEDIQKTIGIPPATKVYSYKEVIEMTSADTYKQVIRDSESTATLVYTSGTTSKPKGVILRHRNILNQVLYNSFNRVDGNKLDPTVGDIFVSILPCWHIFERTAEYFCLSRGCQLIYSNLKNFKKDLTYYRPHILIAVPRLIENMHKTIIATLRDQTPVKRKLISLFMAATQWYKRAHHTYHNLLIRDKKPSIFEKLLGGVLSVLFWPLYKIADAIIWKKIRDTLGGRLKIMVSGGSSLPTNIESLFDLANIKIIAGYGLTETSPVIASRSAEQNVIGTVGKPMPGTIVKIVDMETKQSVPEGKVGVLFVKGPGVMAGYMQNEEATSQAIDEEGFFNTGDLAKINPATGDIIITGRAKDTIVLSNGENIEPQPIEDALVGYSPLVDQVMLVGQDERFLGALVVVNVAELMRRGVLDEITGRKCLEALGATPTTTGVAGDVEILRQQSNNLNDNPEVREMIMNDVSKISEKFRTWEKVATVRILLEPFSIPNGLLTQTLKIKRHEVAKVYSSFIQKMYAKKTSK